jgi:hypothetical protein
VNRPTLILALVFCLSSLGTGRGAEPVRPSTRPAGQNAADRDAADRAADRPSGSLTSNKPLRLFNGRNLEGFYTFIKDRGRDNDPNRVFTVVDGMIRVSGQELGCITTRDEYENYHLIVEYKWGQIAWPPRVEKARDSGVLLHSVGKDGAYSGAWQCSIECNVIEGGTGDFIVVGDGSDQYALTASVRKEQTAGCYIYDPLGAGGSATIHGGRLNWFARDPEWQDVRGFRGKDDVDKPTGEWNRLECLAVGDRIAVKLNGVFMNACRDVRPHRGRIQIQSEMAEIFYRRVDLTPVRGDATAALQRFSASRPSR